MNEIKNETLKFMPVLQLDLILSCSENIAQRSANRNRRQVTKSFSPNLTRATMSIHTFLTAV